MRHHHLATLVGCLVLLQPSGTLAQRTPIVKSDIRAATAPNFGCDVWDRTNEGAWYTLKLVPGGSPSGKDSLRFEGIPTKALGDHGWGCSFSNSLEPSPKQGAARYARWRVKYVSPVNWRSDNRGGRFSANRRTAPDKQFILGNTCEHAPYAPTRVILWQYAAPPDRKKPLLALTQNIGDGTDFLPVPVDTWLNVQIRIQSSSTDAASDGTLSIYVNNNDVNKPTASEKGLHVRTAGWGPDTCQGSMIVWGDGSYNPLSAEDPTTSHIMELADFEYDDEFDASWSIPAKPARGRAAGLSALDVTGLAAGGVLVAARIRRKDEARR